MAERLFGKSLRKDICRYNECLGLFAQVGIWHIYRSSSFQLAASAGMVKNGSINICEDYFKGLECFVNAADDLGNNPMYQIDMAEMTAQYLGGKVEILTKMIDQEYLLGDTLQAVLLQSRFETLMLGMDALLSKHPTLRLNRWLDFASKAAETAQQKNSMK